MNKHNIIIFFCREKMTAINVQLTNNHTSENLSRREILSWINGILNTDYQGIEELCSGKPTKRHQFN